ncbi:MULTISPECIES: hypothetical protein [unclassified Microcoleus]
MQCAIAPRDRVKVRSRFLILVATPYQSVELWQNFSYRCYR